MPFAAAPQSIDDWVLGMKPAGPFKVTFNPAQPPPDPLTILQMARVGERVSLTYATKSHEVAIEMLITTITPTAKRRPRRRPVRAAKKKK